MHSSLYQNVVKQTKRVRRQIASKAAGSHV